MRAILLEEINLSTATKITYSSEIENKWAKEFNSHLHPELINEGNIGLIEGGGAYDGKSTFVKFARPYIIKNIKQALADNPSYKQPYVEPPRVRICGTCLMNRKH